MSARYVLYARYASIPREQGDECRERATGPVITRNRFTRPESQVGDTIFHRILRGILDIDARFTALTAAFTTFSRLTASSLRKMLPVRHAARDRWIAQTRRGCHGRSQFGTAVGSVVAVSEDALLPARMKAPTPTQILRLFFMVISMFAHVDTRERAEKCVRRIGNASGVTHNPVGSRRQL